MQGVFVTGLGREWIQDPARGMLAVSINHYGSGVMRLFVPTDKPLTPTKFKIELILFSC